MTHMRAALFSRVEVEVEEVEVVEVEVWAGGARSPCPHLTSVPCYPPQPHTPAPPRTNRPSESLREDRPPHGYSS